MGISTWTRRKGLILRLSLTLLIPSTFLQAQIISNGSFEGIPRTSLPPEGWSSCHNLSTPDTQPGSFGVSRTASSGNTYISLVTRGNGVENANTTEDVQTELAKPMQKGKVYQIEMDLAYSNVFQFEIYSYTTPAKLQIFGGATPCDKKQLLWESAAIDHIEWKTYSIEIHPNEVDVNFLVLQAQFVNGTTSGNILIDNLTIDACAFAVPIQTKSFNSTICSGDFMIADATSPEASYQWSNGSTEPSVRVTEEGLYKVEVYNGCVTEVFEYDIQTKDCVCEANIPNVFTPNGDGYNDKMEIQTESTITTFNLKVVDRTGGEIFMTDNVNNIWTGTSNGKEMPAGTYYWTLDMSCFQGNKIQENASTGWVQIIK